MKNVIQIKVLVSIISLVLVTMSCKKYDDFVNNEFDYTAVYFANQQMDRTIVTGEWMKIGVGVMLGGKLENKSPEQVTIQLDDALINTSKNTRLPDSYFSLVDENGNVTSEITIPEGSFQGFIYVLLNDQFVNDKLALDGQYALGFTITETSADSILEEKKQTVVTFKYVNTYSGYYYREGSTKQYASDGTTVSAVENYDRDTESNSAWELLTISKDTVMTQWSNQSGITPEMYLVVRSDNSVSVIGKNEDSGATTAGSITAIIDDGENSYDPETRMFSLNYTYTFIDNQGNPQKYEVKDKLVFRNRVIDGVNQWFE